MNQMLLDVINQHRSIRKFKNKPIPDQLLNDILHAGINASTTGNMQLYAMVATTEPGLKERLWAAHFRQNMVKDAPVIVTFCADFNRFVRWCNNRKAVPGYDNFLSFFTAAIDALLAAQNVALAAEANKLGICYLGTTTYMAESIIDILQLPRYVVPVTSIVLGYPDEQPELTGRLPEGAVIHKERYCDFSDKTIDEIYRDREESEFTRKLIQENGTETLAQIFTDKRYRKQDNVTFSKALLNVLEKQGFMNNAD